MYDIEYYEKMLREYSKTAEQISKIRWDWIAELNPKTVLDYGSGVGWFRAWRPKGIKVHSFDIMSVAQTGIDFQMYDLTCFWDVFEHIPDFTEIEHILAVSRNVAVSMPLVSEEIDILKWKHFKPKEHLHYFSEKTLVGLFGKYGFELFKKGTPECPPRVDIQSFVFKNKNWRNDNAKEREK